MKNPKPCYIMGDPVTYNRRLPDHDAFRVEGSPRIGVDYVISAQAIRGVKALDEGQKANLIDLIREQAQRTGKTPEVVSDMVAVAAHRRTRRTD